MHFGCFGLLQAEVLIEQPQHFSVVEGGALLKHLGREGKRLGESGG